MRIDDGIRKTIAGLKRKDLDEVFLDDQIRPGVVLRSRFNFSSGLYWEKKELTGSAENIDALNYLGVSIKRGLLIDPNLIRSLQKYVPKVRGLKSNVIALRGQDNFDISYTGNKSPGYFTYSVNLNVSTYENNILDDRPISEEGLAFFSSIEAELAKKLSNDGEKNRSLAHAGFRWNAWLRRTSETIINLRAIAAGSKGKILESSIDYSNHQGDHAGISQDETDKVTLSLGYKLPVRVGDDLTDNNVDMVRGRVPLLEAFVDEFSG
ncbi:MAG: hypothetical protein AABW73_03660 [Nanoarchaeota archaeon]